MSTGTTYKQCGCRDAATGKPLGRKCPKLRRGNGWNPDHGTWYYQLELPPRADGTRRPPLRKGGFATKTDADAELDRARRTAGHRPSGRPAGRHPDRGRHHRGHPGHPHAARPRPGPQGRRRRPRPRRQAARRRGVAGGMAGRQEEAAARHRAQLRRAHPPVPQAAPRAHPDRPAPGHRRRRPSSTHIDELNDADHRGPRQRQPRPAGGGQGTPAGRPRHLPADPRHPPVGDQHLHEPAPRRRCPPTSPRWSSCPPATGPRPWSGPANGSAPGSTTSTPRLPPPAPPAAGSAPSTSGSPSRARPRSWSGPPPRPWCSSTPPAGTGCTRCGG